MGDSLPRRYGADGVRLVRRADQLFVGDRISRGRLRAVVAGGSPRRRQGHHALSLHHLARDVARRRSRAATPGLGARLRAVGGYQDEQDGGYRRQPRLRDRAPRRGRVALLPAA